MRSTPSRFLRCAAIVAGAASGFWLSPLQAQTLQGRILDDRSEDPIPTALVRLIDESGERHAISIANSTGFFRIEAPGPGVYRLEAARTGFENFETPLLEVGHVGSLY